MPSPHRHRPPAGMPSRSEPNPSEVAISSDESGYIRFIDTQRLIALAKHYHVKHPCAAAGGPLRAGGSTAAYGLKGQAAHAEGSAELRAAFDFGPTRTLQQDVEFGVLQIVDIALKAISPAVNDPTTAISCVDQLEPHPDPLRVPRTA